MCGDVSVHSDHIWCQWKLDWTLLLLEVVKESQSFKNKTHENTINVWWDIVLNMNITSFFASHADVCSENERSRSNLLHTIHKWAYTMGHKARPREESCLQNVSVNPSKGIYLHIKVEGLCIRMFRQW